MGLAVLMALFLVAVGVVVAALATVAWGLFQTFKLGLGAASAVLRRGRT